MDRQSELSRKRAVKHAVEPSVALCKRAWRVICVFTDLPDRMQQEAWRAVEEPTEVAGVLRTLAPWEEYITQCEIVSDVYDYYQEREDCQLRACRHTPNLTSFQAGCVDSMDIPSGLSEALYHLPRLRYLDISMRRLQGADSTTLGDAVARMPQLRTLNMCRVYCDMTRVAHAFVNTRKLEHLDISQMPISLTEVVALSKSLCHLTALRTLSLHRTDIDAHAMAVLEPAFKHLTKLVSLSVSSNDLGAEGAATLARGLAHCPLLETLHISRTELNEAGMRALESALATLPKLEMLMVYRNPLGCGGAESLARALRRAHRLRWLIASRIDMDEQGLRALVSTFDGLRRLEKVEISGNPVPKSTVRMLFKRIRRIQYDADPSTGYTDDEWSDYC